MSPPFRQSPRSPFYAPAASHPTNDRIVNKNNSNRFHHHKMNMNNNPPPLLPSAEYDNKITPELLVDALSGHEDGLLSIAERLMAHYGRGYDAMGEAIIDAFADVQKLFQHVVEAAHMEGAALERERGESEWRKRMVALGMDNVDEVLYGNEQSHDTNNADDQHGDTTTLSSSRSEDLRHEELIDQDVRDVLIDAIKKGQIHRDAKRYDECRALYESACSSASQLLPVDSDHRGRLQLAAARAESMSADRSVAILKYAMDDVLRSGLSLRQGKYPQVDIAERSDCVLSRPNPLRTTPSRGYEVSNALDWGVNDIGNTLGIFNSVNQSGELVHATIVEQSAEEALNSLVEEMKEILAAPVYNMSPLQNVSDKFWLAMSEARKSTDKKEDRLEQALARIKADFLLAREDYEQQIAAERSKTNEMKRQVNEIRSINSKRQYLEVHDRDDRGWAGGMQQRMSCSSPKRPLSTTSQSSGDAAGSGSGHSNHFRGMNENSINSNSSNSRRNRNGSSPSVVSLGSEFAQRARGLVHLLNCQGQERKTADENNPVFHEEMNSRAFERRSGSPR